MFKVFQFGGIKSRDNFGSFLRERGLMDHAVEVGVRKAFFAYRFIKDWKGKHLTLVDPWADLDDYNEYNNENWQKVYNEAKERMKPFGKKVTMCRTTSMIGASVTSNDLDFVYIDANHQYEHVKADMTQWWKKVKVGGILAGHDLFFPGHIGVTNAVIEFCQSNKVIANVVPPTRDKHNIQISAASWWIEKRSKDE